MSTDMNPRTLVATTASAVSAVGILLVPAPAQADPMFPLAPACNQYGFGGDFSLNQSNGYRVEFRSQGTGAHGTATATSASGERMQGRVSGGIDGRNIDFTIDWAKLGTGPGRYSGRVDVNDFANGRAYDANNPSSTATWNSTVPLICIAPTAAPPPPPPPAPASPSPEPAPTPAAITGTVTGDVDVFDVPGGEGNVIGMLRAGRQVQVLGNCVPDDWCNVAIPELPGGSGWIWGHMALPSAAASG